MSKYGIFINHRHDHRALAGRIYDYFYQKGISPFLDAPSLKMGQFETEIIKQIKNTPYFLCLLTENALDNLDPENPEDVYYKELATACDNEKEILIVVTNGFEFPPRENLPDKIKGLLSLQYYRLSDDLRDFRYTMDELYYKNIEYKKLEGTINWRMYCHGNETTAVKQRTILESGIASFDNRFGKEFMDCVRNHNKFDGEYIIKEINMVCYAGSIIFAPKKNLIDRNAYDYGTMFNIFEYLLKDEDFSLRIVTNAPSSSATKDAIKYEKLGNSALAKKPEMIFLASYANVKKLIENEPYKSAYKARRFIFTLTDCCLPYAIFHIIYKDKWSEFNHVKVDLYSFKIDSSVERRSMIFFEKDDKENYDFFVQQFRYINNEKLSEKLIKNNNNKWLEEWRKCNE